MGEKKSKEWVLHGSCFSAILEVQIELCFFGMLAMNIYDFIFVLGAALAFMGFTALAGRAESAMWKKCRRAEKRLRGQQRITLGKSHCR